MDGGGRLATGIAAPTADIEAPAGLVDVAVLGALEVRRDGALVRMGGPKQQLMLGLLVAGGGGAVSVEALIDGVWGVAPPASARGVVQTYVSNLRGALGDVISREGDGYRLDVGRTQVDAWRFEDTVEGAVGSGDPFAAAARLREALGWWRGRPFAGMAASERLAVEARRLEELRLAAVEARVGAELELGHASELVSELEALTGEHPLREGLRRLQMVALYRVGRQADALRVFDRTRELLAEELGIDPSAGLRETHRLVLNQDASLDLAPPAGELRVERRVLLFTDIEDSTAVWEMRPAAMSTAVARHDRIVTAAVEAASGHVVKRVGDAIDATFDDVAAAVAAAEEAQRDLTAASWDEVGALRVRMAVDVGEVEVRGDDLFGPILNRLGRILAAGHGGQVLLSADAHRELSRTQGGWKAKALGEYRFKGIGRPQAVFQLLMDGLPVAFPPLRIDRDPASPRTVAGRVVRGYELRGQVGSGQLGTVYRAYQPSVGREVAVKVIRPEFVNHPDFVRRFEADAQLVARLEHPHVATLFDYWRDPDGAYLVTRWLDGGSLAQVLRRGPYNPEAAVALLDQVGAALAYAHRRGIVHGDVRPSNILLDSDANAYLADFTVTLRPTDDSQAHRPLTSAPAYLPPEQLAGRPASPATDVYGLGLVCFELLAGRPPPLDAPLPTLMDLRADLPAGIDEVIATATATDPPGRFASVDELLAAVHTTLDLPTTVEAGEVFTATRNPYKGLRAFAETDAADFHGRTDVVDELLTALGSHRLVAVVGPSGIGKSSVVHAGLIPALRTGALGDARRWLITTMFPGAWPFEELEAALLRVAVTRPDTMADDLAADDRGLLRATKRVLPPDTQLVLIIDQFEEIFTLTRDQDNRRRFLDALTTAVDDPRSRIRVVLTIRADFLDRPLRYPTFGDLLRTGTVMVTTPDHTELTQAITRPAATVGVRFETGLVDRIVADVNDQPGGLPLLQYALTELFANRTTDLLTADNYHTTGGVLGALGTRAEHLYQELDETRRDTARQIFLRLVGVDETAHDTRRRVNRRELRDLTLDTTLIDDVLNTYTTHRLLTYDRDPTTRSPTVEVAHEALLTAWPRLATWIDQRREDLVLHRRLTDATNEWTDTGRDPTYLLTDGRLDHLDTWAATTDLALTTTEHDYLTTSRTEDLRRRTRTRRRRHAITAILTAAALLATLLALLAINQRERAEQEAQLARARELAAAALNTLDTDPSLSKSLALASADLAVPTIDTVSVLHRAWAADRVVDRYMWPAQHEVLNLWTDLHPDGTLLVAAGHAGRPSTHLEVADLPGGDVLWAYDVDDTAVVIDRPLFSPDGSRVVAGLYWEPDVDDLDREPPGEQLGARIWDAHTGDPIQHFELGRCGGNLHGVTATHLLVATVDRGACFSELTDDTDVTLELVDLATGERQVLSTRLTWWTAAFSGDGRYATFSDDAGPESVTVVEEVATGRRVLEFDPYDHEGPSFGHARALNHDGSLLLAGDRPIAVWNVAEGEIVATFGDHTGESWFSTFSSDGTTVYSTGREGTLRHWDALSGEPISTHPAVGAGRPAQTRDGAVLVADPQTRTGALLDLRPRGEVWFAQTCGGFVLAHTLSAADGYATVAELCPDGDVHTFVIDVSEGEPLYSLSIHHAQHLIISPDGTRFVSQEVGDPVASDDGADAGDWLGPIRVREVRSGAVLSELEGLCTWNSASPIPPSRQEGCAAYPERPFPVWNWKTQWSPDSGSVAVAGLVGLGSGVAVWDAATGEMLGAYDDCQHGAEHMIFTPDGEELIIYCWDEGRIVAVSTDGWEPRRSTKVDPDVEGRDRFSFIGFTPDRTTIVAVGGSHGTGGGSIHWLNADTLDVDTDDSIPGAHDGSPKSWTMSPDGALAATGSSDGFVKVWDVQRRRLVHEIYVGATQVQGLAFVGDRHLAVAPQEGNVYVYTVDVDELLDVVSASLTRGFTVAECQQYNFEDDCPTLEDLRTTTTRDRS